MANESINVPGTFATIQAETSTGNGAFCGGANTDIVTALGATEGVYPLLDLQLIVSAGTTVENDTLEVYRRPKGDGTNAAPAPAGDYKQQYVGSFVIDTPTTAYYYLFGIPNVDENATYYIFNSATNTLTVELKARGRAYGTAA